MSNDPSATPVTPAPKSPPAAKAPEAAPVAAAPPVVAPPAAQPAEAVAFWQSFFLGMTKPGELPVYHHSGLFYWWPVWLFGFLLAAISYFGDTHMALVPARSVLLEKRQVEVEAGKLETRDVIV